MRVGRVGLHGTNLSGMSGQDLGRKTVLTPSDGRLFSLPRGPPS